MKSISILVALALNLRNTDAAVGFGWCEFTHQEEVADFDIDKFTDHDEYGGKWFEVYSDYNIWKWTAQECATSTYAKSEPNKDGKFDMKLTRDFNNRFFGSNDTQEVEIKNSNWYTWASDGTPYEFSGLFSLVRRHHQIIETDYDNYAIAYGCDNIIGGLFHLRWANLLSREPYLQYEQVRSAKERVNSFNYDWDFWWLKSGARCGYVPAPTQDDVMVQLFDTEPDWSGFIPDSAKTLRT